MKNKTGKISGFLAGVLLGFLIIAVLSHLHPEEDLAGIMILTLVLSGLFFSFVGSLLQSYIARRRLTKNSTI
jgi:CDP-diglyceride synthetase